MARLFSMNRVILAQSAARAQAVTGLYLEAGQSLENSLRAASELFEKEEDYCLKDSAEALARGLSPEEAFSMSPILNNLGVAMKTEEKMSSVFQRFSRGNLKITITYLNGFTQVSALMALLISGLFVLCITSSLFDTYYWLMWSY